MSIIPDEDVAQLECAGIRVIFSPGDAAPEGGGGPAPRLLRSVHVLYFVGAASMEGAEAAIGSSRSQVAAKRRLRDSRIVR